MTSDGGGLSEQFELSLTLCPPDRKDGPTYRKRAELTAMVGMHFYFGPLLEMHGLHIDNLNNSSY